MEATSTGLGRADLEAFFRVLPFVREYSIGIVSVAPGEVAIELPFDERFSGPPGQFPASIVGTAGDIEHAAALLHPRMGKPIRAAIGGGAAIIPSNVKIGAVGEVLDVPLGHKDDVWSFDHFDTISVMVPNAPRPDEIVVIVALADGGRPRPRVKKPQ